MKTPYCIKICSRCGELKVACRANFAYHKTAKYNCHQMCKVCKREYEKERRSKKTGKKPKDNKVPKDNKPYQPGTRFPYQLCLAEPKDLIDRLLEEADRLVKDYNEGLRKDPANYTKKGTLRKAVEKQFRCDSKGWLKLSLRHQFVDFINDKTAEKIGFKIQNGVQNTIETFDKWNKTYNEMYQYYNPLYEEYRDNHFNEYLKNFAAHMRFEDKLNNIFSIASEEGNIKSVYRALLNEYHPDKTGRDTSYECQQVIEWYKSYND